MLEYFQLFFYKLNGEYQIIQALCNVFTFLYTQFYICVQSMSPIYYVNNVRKKNYLSKFNVHQQGCQCN